MLLMTTTPTTGSFQILTYSANHFGEIVENFPFPVKPHSVKRLSDGEVFTLGDRVSNDLMKGKITEFRITNGTMFVITTWSGIGMDIDSVHKLNTLPSKYQEGDKVRLDYHGTCFDYGWINKVHFGHNNKVTGYDVEILVQVNGKSHNFRMYNVDSDFVKDRTHKKGVMEQLPRDTYKEVDIKNVQLPKGNNNSI